MIDIREIEDKNLINTYLSGGVSIFAKYFGAKIVINRGNNGLVFFKNKNYPITNIDFIINDIYEKPVKILRETENLFHIGRTYYFTYDYRCDILICDNPDDTINCSGITNNDMIFGGILDNEVKNLFINKHTNKIISNFPNIGIEPLSIIVKSKTDGKCIFKVDNGKIKLPSFKLPSICSSLMEQVISFIDLDDISRLCIDKKDEHHIYIKIINKIFTKFINAHGNEWSDVDLQTPNLFKPKNISDKYFYLDKEVVKIIQRNQNLFYVYALFINQFRKTKLFVSDNNKAISDKYIEIHNKMRDICVNNIFSTSLPPINEILN